MELLREIEDERKARLNYLPQHTGINSLGFFGLPAGSPSPGVGLIPAFVVRLRPEPRARMEIHTPPLSAEQINAFASHEVAGPQSSPRGLRERELEWRRTHAMELRRYENQWVVLEGEEIIAHNSDAAEAIRQARSRGIRTPYIFFVEPESDMVRIGL